MVVRHDNMSPLDVREQGPSPFAPHQAFSHDQGQERRIEAVRDESNPPVIAAVPLHCGEPTFRANRRHQRGTAMSLAIALIISMNRRPTGGR
jgi:hypothetical protein